MSDSVHDIVDTVVEMDIDIEEQSNHYKLYTNTLRPFEVDLLQDALADEEYTAWRFNDEGVEYLKIPRSSP